MDLGNIGSTGLPVVASITVICFLLCEFIKSTPLDNKWLPTIAGLLGAILGVVGYNSMPNYPAQDYITATAVGIVSGLAATGINQIYKQLKYK